jgi:YbgC/YbaW family acyl-CoA thioester hydrolase
MDEFDFTIWLLNWKRVRGTRSFEVKRKSNGEIIAQGVQQIACMDSKTQRPISPPMILIDKFLLDTAREIPSQRFPKIPAAPERSLTLQIKATWQDMDILEVINSAVYIGYAEEAAAQLFTASGWSPEELKIHRLALVIHRLHIQYQMPAVWDDTLNTTIFSLKLDKMGGSFCVSMKRASDGAYIASCILNWGLIDRGNAEAHPLPVSLSNALTESLVF